MQFFTFAELATKASNAIASRRRLFGSLHESDSVVMANDASQHSTANKYDLFLSHSFTDAHVVYGLRSALVEYGLSSYVYWIDESAPQAKVSPEIAERLRLRMKACRGLLYATSENAENSKWMPWELGYFDGVRGKVAVCPVTNSTSFDGREYLGLYPIMEKDFWLWKDDRVFKRLRDWLNES